MHDGSAIALEHVSIALLVTKVSVGTRIIGRKDVADIKSAAPNNVLKVDRTYCNCDIRTGKSNSSS